MCGIAGYFRRDGKEIDYDILKKMSEKLLHRGPDASGIYAARNIGLVHRRLSIRDLSSAANQPMTDQDKRFVTVFNGEIYNYSALKKELQKKNRCNFKTTSDTELILFGYKIWGLNFFNKIEGMFAIAIWDCEKKEIVLARDSIGIKPLYYYLDDQKLIFASEIKSILSSNQVKKNINPESLHVFLAAGYPGPSSSILSDVFMLSPGSTMTISLNNSRNDYYWKPSRSGEIKNIDDASDEFISIFEHILKEHLISDVPIASFQSGGIDSSIIALTLRRLNQNITSYTASFTNKFYDETSLAKEVIEVTKAAHNIIKMENSSSAEDIVKKIAFHSDGQCADASAFAFYSICGNVKKSFKVIISGDGGDEFFGGYDTYKASLMSNFLHPWLPRSSARLLGDVMYKLNSHSSSRLTKSSIIARFMQGYGYGGMSAHAHWRRLMPDFLARKIYTNSMLSQLNYSPLKEYESFLNFNDAHFSDSLLLADQSFHLQSILAKVDTMSMAHGLEVRGPFLDRRIMDFAGKCSTDILLPNKKILKEVARKIEVPSNIINATKKGFNVPISEMLQTSLSNLANKIFLTNPDVFQPFLAPDKIREIYLEHSNKKNDHSYALWPLLILGIWLMD